jgi:hypothetical protein
VNTQHKSQTADLHHLESKTMNELFNLIRQHYEKNEAGGSRNPECHHLTKIKRGVGHSAANIRAALF